MINDNLPEADFILVRDLLVHLKSNDIILCLGNIKKYDYDFYKLKKLKKVKDLYSKKIVEGMCNCEWQCALPINMLYDPSVYFKIFKGLFSPSKIVQSVPQAVWEEAK